MEKGDIIGITVIVLIMVVAIAAMVAACAFGIIEFDPNAFLRGAIIGFVAVS